MDKLIVAHKLKKCDFCGSAKNNELKYGLLYTLEKITAHYYCVLLSSQIIQKGADNEGMFGFLLSDIKAELKRSLNDICYYCGGKRATLVCFQKTCRKKFHLPCGLKNGSLCQFFGCFKNFCSKHKPIQMIPKQIFLKFKSSALCLICYGKIYIRGHHSIRALWAPCCQKTWYHKDCIQKLALSAGYLFKCPICSDKKKFRSCMLRFGIFIPQKDASWELAPNAYEELLFRHNKCDADDCKCPDGRQKNVEETMWEIILCQSCGSQGMHIACGRLKFVDPEWECASCAKITVKRQKNITTCSEKSNMKFSKEGISKDIPGSSMTANKPFHSIHHYRKKRKISENIDDSSYKKRKKISGAIRNNEHMLYKTLDSLTHPKNGIDSDNSGALIDIEIIETSILDKRTAFQEEVKISDKEVLENFTKSINTEKSLKNFENTNKKSEMVSISLDGKSSSGSYKESKEIIFDSSDQECEVFELSDSDSEVEVICEIKNSSTQNKSSACQRNSSKTESSSSDFKFINFINYVAQKNIPEKVVKISQVEKSSMKTDLWVALHS